MNQLLGRKTGLVWLFIILNLSIRAMAQQSVHIDWDTRQPISPPITVDKSVAVAVVVDNVNDMLYSYKERIIARERTVDNIFPEIIQAARQAGPGTDACKPLADALKSLDDAFAGPALNPKSDTKATLPHSIRLGVTRAAYDKARGDIEALASKVGSCTDADLKNRAANYRNVTEAKWDQLERLPHTFTFSTVLEPLTDYSILLLEQFEGVTTDACTKKDDNGNLQGVDCEVVYQPKSTTITLSGGFLITTLPAPAYARGSAPDGSTVLVVNNLGGVRTAFTTLINIKVPGPGAFNHICPSDDSGFGCAISVGPAVQLSSDYKTATRLGLVAGWSFQLWRYLYVTPAVHIGEYDNFPAGFSQAGQVIPSTFTSELTPTKRTTARFALGLTFKGWDLLHKNSTSQGTTKSGNAPTTK